MQISQIAGIVIMVLFVMAVLRARRKRGGRILGSPGPGAAGAIYDMLNEDKRRAIEIIAEQKAEETDPRPRTAISPSSNHPTALASSVRLQPDWQGVVSGFSRTSLGHRIRVI